MKRPAGQIGLPLSGKSVARQRRRNRRLSDERHRIGIAANRGTVRRAGTVLGGLWVRCCRRRASTAALRPLRTESVENPTRGRYFPADIIRKTPGGGGSTASWHSRCSGLLEPL